jgi:hypothetical protein
LSARAQRLEAPDAQVREIPDAGIFAVADQILVAGHDLAVALRDQEDLAEAVSLVEAVVRRV